MSSFFFLGIVVIFSILGIRELFEPSFFESHDGIIHVMRLAHFDQALKDGQFPVRWLPTWMAGYGSPVFNFNWSLPYYLGSILHALGLSYQTSVEAVFALTYSLSGIFCYLLVKNLLANNWAALTGSVLYIWAPYRFTDIFVRGALGEASAFLFLPLLFWLTLELTKSASNSKLLITSLAWAGFILTHNIMSLVGVGIISSFLVWKLINESGQWQFFKKGFLAIVLGLSLSASFILPAIFEKKYSRISELETIYNYKEQFVPLAAIINSPWKYAYAVPKNQEFSMSFQLGLIHLMIPLLILVMLVFVRKQDKLRVWGFFFLLVFLLTIFLTNPASEAVYELTSLPSVINFPWRFLAATTFASSILSAILVIYVQRWAWVLTLGLIALSIAIYLPYSKIVSWQFTATDSQYREMIRTNINFLPDTEFLPISNNYLQLLADRGPATKRLFFEDDLGLSKISNFEKNNLSYFAEIETNTAVIIRANTFYFPGWKLKTDGQSQSIAKDQYGLINFQIDPGSHHIELSFKNTAIRKVANGIMILALAVLGYLMIRETKFRGKLANE